jgi:hypothetical protein
MQSGPKDPLTRINRKIAILKMLIIATIVVQLTAVVVVLAR